METENRLAATGLSQQLDNVRSFSFFQLGSLLSRFAELHNAVHEDPVLVRYRALPSLAFPASDVDRCELHLAGHRQFLDVTVTFMGLFGPASPLPAFYTERVIQSSDQDNPSRELMDMFNHRCISLLQTCWKKYRYYSQYQNNGMDQYSQWLLSLLGVNQALLQQSTRLRWHKLLPYAGLLLSNVCSMDVLSRIVRVYFDLSDVRVQPWVRRQVQVADDQQNRIGMCNAAMGEDLVLGETLEDYAGKFALHLHNLNLDQYQRLLPEGEEHIALIELVRFALKDPLDFDLHLHLNPGCFQQFQSDAGTGQLGWNACLGDAPSDPEQNETVICIADYAIV